MKAFNSGLALVCTVLYCRKQNKKRSGEALPALQSVRGCRPFASRPLPSEHLGALRAVVSKSGIQDPPEVPSGLFCA